MKLKYYLRGLGIGIAVTAVIMGIALPQKKTVMTDQEIRARALELGMSDDSAVLAQALKEENQKPEVSSNSVSEDGIIQQEETVEPPAEEPADEPLGELIDEPLAQPAEELTEKPAEEPAEKPAVEPADEPVSTDEIRVFTVNSGDGSYTVARNLKNEGLISDAEAFDQYLCQNGYDKRIKSGNHEIKAGASEAEIAEALTRR